MAEQKGEREETPQRDGRRHNSALSHQYRKMNSEQTTPSRPANAPKRKSQPYPLAQQNSAEAKDSELMTTKEKRTKKSDAFIQRQGLLSMDPFALVQDENEELKNAHPEVSPLVLRWFKAEYFYSWVDRSYYLRNEFRQLLEALSLKPDSMLTAAEWSLVRQALGKPRRFSEAFIEEERKQLHVCREIFREIIRSMH